MVFDLLTIFPKIFDSYLSYGLLKQVLDKKIIKINIHDLRAKDPITDDRPFGGGPGMVMKIGPIVETIEAIKKKSKIILLSPKGKKFNPKKYVNLDRLILICGRYEGIDERVKKFIHEEVSVGDYILSGGELPALIIIEAITRFLPNALGNKESLKDFGYPVYTKPREFRGLKVPKVLLSGNHAKIKKWRLDRKK
ncbi:MAG: tRNA (guanosine(37)-N1)-methyltransferase TrmD [bacterium]